MAISTDPLAARRETVAAILVASGRRSLPLRHSFVQMRAPDGRLGPGPLAELVRRGQGTGLEQYLIFRAWASAEPFDVTRSARLWARTVGLADTDSSRRTVTRNWRLLEALGLVERERRGHLVRVTALREDGSGRPYDHPGARGEPYLQLSPSYWQDGWDERLALPAKAVLLIALTLGDFFWLPPRHAPDWYGLSPSTVERGLRQLRREGLIRTVEMRKRAPLAPAGYTLERRHVLEPPFGPKGRLARGARR